MSQHCNDNHSHIYSIYVITQKGAQPEECPLSLGHKEVVFNSVTIRS